MQSFDGGGGAARPSSGPCDFLIAGLNHLSQRTGMSTPYRCAETTQRRALSLYFMINDDTTERCFHSPPMFDVVAIFLR
jgi:hypothetical protein